MNNGIIGIYYKKKLFITFVDSGKTYSSSCLLYTAR